MVTSVRPRVATPRKNRPKYLPSRSATVSHGLTARLAQPASVTITPRKPATSRPILVMPGFYVSQARLRAVGPPFVVPAAPHERSSPRYHTAAICSSGCPTARSFATRSWPPRRTTIPRPWSRPTATRSGSSTCQAARSRWCWSGITSRESSGSRYEEPPTRRTCCPTDGSRSSATHDSARIFTAASSTRARKPLSNGVKVLGRYPLLRVVNRRDPVAILPLILSRTHFELIPTLFYCPCGLQLTLHGDRAPTLSAPGKIVRFAFAYKRLIVNHLMDLYLQRLKALAA